MAKKLWEDGVDYEARIQQNLRDNDYRAAWENEQARNQKIDDLGLGYDKTNRFGSYYDYANLSNGELGEVYGVREAVRNGSTDWRNANNYVEGIRKGHGYSGGKEGMDYIPLAGGGRFSYDAAPQYLEDNQRFLDAVDAYLNRGHFSYDPYTDPLYASYKKTYTREGDRAMQDTLGAAAAATGGIPSTYAIGAANQANDYYRAQMADVIPQLEQLAYDRWRDEGNDMLTGIGLLGDIEQQRYDRYRDALGQYNTDRSFAYGAYRDQVGDQRYADQDAYQRERDANEDALERAKMIASLYGDDSALAEYLGYTPPAAETTGGGLYYGGGNDTTDMDPAHEALLQGFVDAFNNGDTDEVQLRNGLTAAVRSGKLTQEEANIVLAQMQGAGNNLYIQGQKAPTYADLSTEAKQIANYIAGQNDMLYPNMGKTNEEISDMIRDLDDPDEQQYLIDLINRRK